MSATKILFHIHALRAGGAERQLTYLVKGLVEKGFEPHVLTLYPGGEFWEELISWGGCSLVSLNRKSSLDFSVITKLSKYIRENEIDLIQGWMPPANSFAVIAGVFSRRPVVMGVRAATGDYPTIGGKFYLRTDGLLGRLYAQRIVCNSYQGMQFHATLGYPTDKLHVILNGIEVPASFEANPPFSHAPPWRLGIIARLDVLKDHSTLFHAVKLLLDAGERITLEIFGDGPPDYKADLKQIVCKLGISSFVTWHGHVSDCWNALKSVDVVVSTSLTEGMPNVVLEAMAAGKVIVATNVGDIPLLIDGDKGRCGYLAPVRDARNLAKTIQEALHNQEQSKKLAAHARNIVQKYYSTESMVHQYQQLYTNLLNNRT